LVGLKVGTVAGFEDLVGVRGVGDVVALEHGPGRADQFGSPTLASGGHRERAKQVLVCH
jgi:hypothetical protein